MMLFSTTFSLITTIVSLDKKATFYLLVLLLLCQAITITEAATRKPFTDPIELRQAVDVILSQDSADVVRVEAAYGPIEDWDVSRINDFSELFSARTRNPLAADVDVDLSRWNVSHATTMNDMFLEAAKIDFDVSMWDVSSVEEFQGMFEGATSFRGHGLEKWNVQSGKLFMVMFADTTSLIPTVDLRSWNVHNAEQLTAMFRNSSFGSSNKKASGVIRSENVTYNLCNWASILSSTADTDDMFLHSQCPESRSPQLMKRLASSVSFCVPCGTYPIANKGRVSSSADHPNVLLIMADQMRYDMIRAVQDTLSHYDDHLKIETPNLDKLLEQGAYFESAYCQCAVCAPARTSIRTGCTIERTGIQHNDLIDEHEYQNGDIFVDRLDKLVGIDQVLVDKLGYVSE
jgi:hypothetical protein